MKANVGVGEHAPPCNRTLLFGCGVDEVGKLGGGTMSVSARYVLWHSRPLFQIGQGPCEIVGCGLLVRHCVVDVVGLNGAAVTLLAVPDGQGARLSPGKADTG